MLLSPRLGIIIAELFQILLCIDIDLSPRLAKKLIAAFQKSPRAQLVDVTSSLFEKFIVEFTSTWSCKPFSPHLG